MEETVHMINMMAPYLLLGFFLAGVMHVFVPSSVFRKHMSRPDFKSVLLSTLVGIPIPLCSCGVIPTAMSLRKEGASRGAVIAFLIATPQTGVDSILATYSMMGLPFAIVRPVAALFTAVFGGLMSNLSDRLHPEGQDVRVCGKQAAAPVETHKDFWEKMKDVFRYAYLEMMQDIGKWLVVGLVIAGLITAFVPAEWIAGFSGNTLLSILIVLLCAIPMYVCATGSIPIAIALMMKGLSPGAALVLLMAGPAVNVASMLVIRKVMGWRSLAVYLVSIIFGATFFALGIDWLFPEGFFTSELAVRSACCEPEAIPWYRWVFTGILVLLLVNALVRRFVAKPKKTDGERCLHIEGMKCNHCRANALKAIQAVPGVQDVEIDLASGNASVKGKYNGDEIVRAVAALGFSASFVEGEHIAVERPLLIRIKGMKCNHCAANVKKAIEGVVGVQEVEVDLASGTARVSGRFSTDEVLKAVEDIGFTPDDAQESCPVE